MATKQQEPIRRNDVIRCEFCGEDYSVTYKRCPFCDGKPSRGGESREGGTGGKRLVTNKRGGGYGGGMEPVQIIGLALSIILIIAALYIVYTVVSPLLGKGKTPSNPGTSSTPGTSQSQSQSQGQSSASQSGASSGGASSSGASSIVTPPIPAVTTTAIKLSSADFTLPANGSYQLKATLTPADSTDTIVWTSSNEAVAVVSQDGTVTNVNKGSTKLSATITATVGDVTATCWVRCSGGSTGTTGGSTGGNSGSTGGNSGSTGGGTTVASGTTGTVTGTITGLLIRSGPGKEYEAQATATNGAVVTILEDTGTGWYKISYNAGGGRTETGYVSKDYISVK